MQLTASEPDVQRPSVLMQRVKQRDQRDGALKPHPAKQAKMMFWQLVKRVPLSFVAIPETEIATACERFRISVATWRRQERAFGLMKQVYAKRAAVRGHWQERRSAPV